MEHVCVTAKYIFWKIIHFWCTWNATFHSATSWVIAGGSQFLVWCLWLKCELFWTVVDLVASQNNTKNNDKRKKKVFLRCWVPAACHDTKPSQYDSRLDSGSRRPKRGRDFNRIRKQPQQSEAKWNHLTESHHLSHAETLIVSAFISQLALSLPPCISGRSIWYLIPEQIKKTGKKVR